MSRTIAVFTSTRADAGPLGPVIDALARCEEVDLVVIASGTHLDVKRGYSLAGLETSVGSKLEVVDAGPSDDDPAALSKALGAVTSGVSSVLETHGVDVLVVLGDRWELLGAVGAAIIHQVPIAHLHGGEITEGSLDERVRHAVTKLADIHFCAAEPFRERILQMGEEPARIHVTGAPGLDRFNGVGPLTDAELQRQVGADLPRPVGLVTYQPPTVDRRHVRERARAVFDAAADVLGSVLVTYPGLDPGGNAIIEEIEAVCAERPTVHAVPNLGEAYPSVLASVDVMVGNSSSGIIEAASFRLPVVNVGERQAGRLQPSNVIQSGEERHEVEAQIRRALTQEFRAGLADLSNPYGDGRAAARVLDVLLSIPLEPLRRKRFVDAS